MIRVEWGLGWGCVVVTTPYFSGTNQEERRYKVLIQTRVLNPDSLAGYRTLESFEIASYSYSVNWQLACQAPPPYSDWLQIVFNFRGSVEEDNYVKTTTKVVSPTMTLRVQETFKMLTPSMTGNPEAFRPGMWVSGRKLFRTNNTLIQETLWSPPYDPNGDGIPEAGSSGYTVPIQIGRASCRERV